MQNQIVIGIGCFAKPERLSRIFNKLVQDYALGSVEDNQLFGQNIPAEGEGADLLRSLMAGPGKGRSSGKYKPIRFPEHKIITGFYLSLLDQKLNLKIFAKGNRSKREIYSAELHDLTRLRRERLN